jgi:hypothetical protein
MNSQMQKINDNNNLNSDEVIIKNCWFFLFGKLTIKLLGLHVIVQKYYSRRLDVRASLTKVLNKILS